MKPGADPKRTFFPQGGLRKFWGCKDRSILLEGPAGTGKTRCGLEKAYLMAMKYPGCRILFVRKTRESMTQTVLQIFEQWVVPEGSYVVDGPSRKMRESYVLKNGSEIVIAGLDKPEKVMSAEYDAIFCFEATELTENDFELLTSRMDRRKGVIPYSQIVCDCNPEAPSHWLNRRASRGLMTRIKTSHRDNPVFFDEKAGQFTEQGESYLARLRELSGVRRLRLLDGQWRVSEGAVYPEFEFSKHVIPRADFEKMPWRDWRKVRSIDFGFQNPFVCLWAAIDSDGDIYIYRQIYRKSLTVQEHTLGIWDETDGKKELVESGIKQLSEPDGPIEETVADHDAGDRATMERCGIITAPAYKVKGSVEEGIEAVKLRLRDTIHGDGIVRPRIYFVEGNLVKTDDELIEARLPLCTEDEFANYRYSKQPKDDADKSRKEEPIKKDDHGMDALRYLVCYADDIGGTQIEVYAEAPVIVDNPALRQF